METAPANTQPDTPEISSYMLLFRGKDWDEGLPPDQLRQTMTRFAEWSTTLAHAGKIKGGEALARSGKIISGQNGQVLTDGPYPEAKEAIGGTLHLNVQTLEEALAIARTSPVLEFGGTIEIRPVLSECPIFKRAREKHGITLSTPT